MAITAKAQGKTFTFPDGTDQAQMGSAIDEFFSGQSGQADTSAAAQVGQVAGRGRNRTAVEPQPLEQQQGPIPPPIGPTKGQRAGVVQATQRKETEARESELFEQFQAGNITSKDLSEKEDSAIQQKRVESIPELTGRFRNLSENLDFTDALATMTAFDPDEFGRILTKSDPNIGIVITPEGERLARNNETGDIFSINKLGPSLIDAIQIGGAVAAFSPAGRVATLGKAAVASGATQAAIEAGQAIKGGEFDVGEVALAAGAVPVVAKGVEAAISAVKGLRGAGTTAIEALEQTPSNVPDFLPGPSVDEVASTTGELLPVKNPLFGQQSKSNQALFEALSAGTAENKTAGYIIDGAGKVAKSPTAQKARKVLNDATVSAMTGASQKDKAGFREMLDILERGIKSGKEGLKHRPDLVVGKTIMDRFKFVANKNKAAAGKLDGTAEKLKGQNVNFSDDIVSFKDDMNKIGVSVVDDVDDAGNPTGTQSLDFFDSEAEDSPSTKKMLNLIWKHVQRLEKNPDASRAHKIKKIIDSKIFATKKSPGGLDANGERIAAAFRKSIDDRLDATFPEYNSVNTEISKTLKVLNEFSDMAGKNFEPNKDNVNAFAGNLSRRLISNATSRTRLTNAINDLEKVGVELGGKFDDDMFTQLMFLDALETSFGSFAPTSFSGQIERAAGRALTQSKTGAAADLAIDVTKKVFGVNEKKAIEILREFVK